MIGIGWKISRCSPPQLQPPDEIQMALGTNQQELVGPVKD